MIVSLITISLPIPYFPPILFRFLTASDVFILTPFIDLMLPLLNSITIFFALFSCFPGGLHRTYVSSDGSSNESISEPDMVTPNKFSLTLYFLLMLGTLNPFFFKKDNS